MSCAFTFAQVCSFLLCSWFWTWHFPVALCIINQGQFTLKGFVLLTCAVHNLVIVKHHVLVSHDHASSRWATLRSRSKTPDLPCWCSKAIESRLFRQYLVRIRQHGPSLLCKCLKIILLCSLCHYWVWYVVIGRIEMLLVCRLTHTCVALLGHQQAWRFVQTFWAKLFLLVVWLHFAILKLVRLWLRSKHHQEPY